jgi:hypothetical protein
LTARLCASGLRRPHQNPAGRLLDWPDSILRSTFQLWQQLLDVFLSVGVCSSFSAEKRMSLSPTFPAKCPNCQQSAGEVRGVRTVAYEPAIMRLMVRCGCCQHGWEIDKDADTPNARLQLPQDQHESKSIN